MHIVIKLLPITTAAVCAEVKTGTYYNVKIISSPTDRRDNLPIFLQRQSSLSAISYETHKIWSP